MALTHRTGPVEGGAANPAGEATTPGLLAVTGFGIAGTPFRDIRSSNERNPTPSQDQPEGLGFADGHTQKPHCLRPSANAVNTPGRVFDSPSMHQNRLDVMTTDFAKPTTNPVSHNRLAGPRLGGNV